MNLRVCIALLVLFACHELAFADPVDSRKLMGAYGQRYSQVSACWGVSYRLNNEYYNQFALERSFYRTTCTNRSFTGYGVNATFFGDGNYSFGVKYFRAGWPWRGHSLNTYWAIAPSWFSFEGASGFNMKPIVGFKFSPLYGDAVSVDLDVFYGYDIPVIHEREFTVGRHDFSALLSLTFNIDRIAYLLFRSEAEKELSRRF